MCRNRRIDRRLFAIAMITLRVLQEVADAASQDPGAGAVDSQCLEQFTTLLQVLGLSVRVDDCRSSEGEPLIVLFNLAAYSRIRDMRETPESASARRTLAGRVGDLKAFQFTLCVPLGCWGSNHGILWSHLVHAYSFRMLRDLFGGSDFLDVMGGLPVPSAGIDFELRAEDSAHYARVPDYSVPLLTIDHATASCPRSQFEPQQPGKMLVCDSRSGAHRAEYSDANKALYDMSSISEALQPLFMEQSFIRNAFGRYSWDSSVPDARTADISAIALAHYHRTGTAFCNMLQGVLSGLTGWVEVDHFNASGVDVFPVDSDLPSGSISRYVFPSSTWALPPTAGSRVVHFVRDPVDIIISSYKYHRLQREVWTSCARRCVACYAEDARWLFEHCDQCAMDDILLHCTEAWGLEAMYRLLRRLIDLMLANVARWASNPQVLHLSVEHFRSDFDVTTMCLYRFLSLDRVPTNKAITPEKFLRSMRDVPYLEGHATYNLDLGRHGVYKNMLEGDPRYGAQFRRIRILLSIIYESQAQLYGCPVLP